MNRDFFEKMTRAESLFKAVSIMQRMKLEESDSNSEKYM